MFGPGCVTSSTPDALRVTTGPGKSCCGSSASRSQFNGPAVSICARIYSRRPRKDQLATGPFHANSALSRTEPRTLPTRDNDPIAVNTFAALPVLNLDDSD